MNITVFTSNQARHLYLINELSKIAKNVYAIQECNTVFPGKIKDFYNNSSIMQEYFNHVITSEYELFGNVSFLAQNVYQLAIKSGDLNNISLDTIKPALQSDIYIIFGASYIKSELIDFLINHAAINIHMGVSPYFRGSATNFWASYKKHFDMIGATIHKLSKGLDSGDIIYHALPKAEKISPFLLGMKSVKIAIDSVVQRISTNEIFSIPTIKQDKSQEIFYSKASDFTDAIAKDYLKNLPTKEEIYHVLKERNLSLFKDAYIG